MEYIKPEIELIVLETEDVITASGGSLDPLPEYPDEDIEF